LDFLFAPFFIADKKGARQKIKKSPGKKSLTGRKKGQAKKMGKFLQI
jgi:hypothetical protein